MSIRLVLADVDGTLVRSDKSLSERSIAAVRALGAAGIRFAITSGRPPRGMEMLVDPLALATPIAGFNGGVTVDPEMTVLEQRCVPKGLVAETISLLEWFSLDVWLYRGSDWLIRDRSAPHVDREAFTVQFEPTVVETFAGIVEDVAKVVGVGDDYDAVARAAQAVRDALGTHVAAARSQPYYVDVTHPRANKGAVVTSLARRFELVWDEIATIGDMPNDVLMFAHSGLSIAMGNADEQVQRAARHVTGSNDDDGFADAMERFVLNSKSEQAATAAGRERGEERHGGH
jgi:Cof subfamily protein (haloacid dehalogenase superfamily)